MLKTVFLCSVQNKLADRKKSAWKTTFNSVLNQCKQQHGTSLVYLTKKSKLCLANTSTGTSTTDTQILVGL